MEYGKNLERNWLVQMHKHAMKKKKDLEFRKWVAQHTDANTDTFFKTFYDSDSDDEKQPKSTHTQQHERSKSQQDFRPQESKVIYRAESLDGLTDRENEFGNSTLMYDSMKYASTDVLVSDSEHLDTSCSDIETLLKENQIVERKIKHKMRRKRHKIEMRFLDGETEMPDCQVDAVDDDLFNMLTDKEIRALRLKLVASRAAAKAAKEAQELAAEFGDVTDLFGMVSAAMAKLNAPREEKKFPGKHKKKKKKRKGVRFGDTEHKKVELKERFMQEYGFLLTDDEASRIVDSSDWDSEEDDLSEIEVVKTITNDPNKDKTSELSQDKKLNAPENTNTEAESKLKMRKAGKTVRFMDKLDVHEIVFDDIPGVKMPQVMSPRFTSILDLEYGNRPISAATSIISTSVELPLSQQVIYEKLMGISRSSSRAKTDSVGSGFNTPTSSCGQKSILNEDVVSCITSEGQEKKDGIEGLPLDLPGNNPTESAPSSPKSKLPPIILTESARGTPRSKLASKVVSRISSRDVSRAGSSRTHPKKKKKRRPKLPPRPITHIYIFRGKVRVLPHPLAERRQSDPGLRRIKTINLEPFVTKDELIHGKKKSKKGKRKKFGSKHSSRVTSRITSRATSRITSRVTSRAVSPSRQQASLSDLDDVFIDPTALYRTNSARSFGKNDKEMTLHELTDGIDFPAKAIKIQIAERKLRKQRRRMSELAEILFKVRCQYGKEQTN